MQALLRNIDCVVEIHDARIPFSGRNPRFKDTISLRPHLLLLNKVDLMDESYNQRITDKLLQEGVNKVLFTDCKRQQNPLIKKEIIPTMVELIQSRPRYHRESIKEYNIMVIGIPNVGKSSFINVLRQSQLKRASGRPTRVGSVAGVTRSVLEKITVSYNPMIFLYDTPGILSPTVRNVEVGMKLALCSTLQDHLVGVETIVDYMLFWLNRHEKFEYVKHFELEEPTDDVMKFLAHIAFKHNKTRKARSQEGSLKIIHKLDFNAAATMVLQAFRNGDLGNVMLDDNSL